METDPLNDMTNKLVKCECGCGNEGPSAAMRNVRLAKTAGGVTRAIKTWRVLRTCEDHFRKEMALTQETVRFLQANQKTGIIGRALRMRQLVRLQHAIHQRRYGFDYSKKTAIRSGIVFVAPTWIGKILVSLWRTSATLS